MKIEFIADSSGGRLDQLIKLRLPDISRARIQKNIKDGHCLVNGKLEQCPAHKSLNGDLISLNLQEDESRLMPSNGELPVIWQDDHLAVINKPAGLTVHPCPSCTEETLVHRLLYIFPQLKLLGGERPGIVHRLDKDTSGLMLVALTEIAQQTLAEMFSQHKIEKVYLAFVHGRPDKTGQTDAPIGRHPTQKTRMAISPLEKGGKAAFTSWQLLWRNQDTSLLKISIKTGRTHQIRVHMAALGFPLLGDHTYAPKSVAEIAPSQLLHAWQLSFPHPLTGKQLNFCATPPESFFAPLLSLSSVPMHLVITGNQGCGKSSFCHALQALGIPVISADDIVAKLYAHPGPATEWIATHIGNEAINPDGAVDKPELFRYLQQKPWLKQELEQVIHNLVQERIESFWNAQSGQPIVCAEIPLYFESVLSKQMRPKPFVVGISCPKEERFERLKVTRHWSQEKIATMESWQWPEERKMQACDHVITNNGTPKQLEQAAQALIQDLKDKLASQKQELAKHLFNLCSCPGQGS